MSFKQSEHIPPEYQHLAAKVREVSQALAAVAASSPTMDVDRFDNLVARTVTSDHASVKGALEAMLITRQVRHTVCNRCRLVESECFCDEGFAPYSKTLVEIIGEISTLVKQIAEPSLGAEPYFISLYVDEGRAPAEAIHAALNRSGFLCTESIGSNAEWRSKIEPGLRAAKTFIIIETPGYYTRPFCLVELVFALASGLRVLLVGLTDTPVRSAPRFMREIQRRDYRTSAGGLNLPLLLSTTLEEPVSLSLRKEAVRSLLDMCDGVYLRRLADQLHILDVMPSDSAPLGQLRNALISKVFGGSSPVKADELVDHFDFSQVIR